MPTVVAIDIAGDQATIVTGMRGDDDTLQLLSVHTVPYASLLTVPEVPVDSAFTAAEADEHEAGVSSDDSLSDVSYSNNSPNNNSHSTNFHGANAAANGHFPSIDLHTLVNAEIDSAVALLSGDHVLYKNITLPFNNPKKIEQAAPLQIQDYVPFDIEDFVLDHLLLGKNSDGSWNVLSSLAPQHEVAETLSRLVNLGIEPKVLSTRASALTALLQLSGETLESAVVILECSNRRCSLVLLVDGRLESLREMPLLVEKHFGEERYIFDPQFVSDINCSIAKLEREHQTRVRMMYLLGPAGFRKQCAEAIPIPVTSLDLSNFVTTNSEKEIVLDEISWAIGLLASELVPPNDETIRLIDFRKGQFAYKPAWRNLWNALQTELFPIILAFVFGIGWYASVLYKASNALTSVETRISEIVTGAVSGETVPARREVSYLEGRVTELEEQLRGIGSLSTLSPLESLKELSAAISPNIDVDVEGINISQSGISFRGSVLDNPSLGRLSSALEKHANRFCSVKVDPKGRTPAGRVKYSADIGFCE